jgi:hypothetical protein
VRSEKHITGTKVVVGGEGRKRVNRTTNGAVGLKKVKCNLISSQLRNKKKKDAYFQTEDIIR